MKHRKIPIFILLCSSILLHAANEKPAPDTVVVKVIKPQLPPEKDKRWQFLWDIFDNSSTDEFRFYGTQNWENNFSIFANALVQKAADQNLDSESLRKVLGLIFKHSNGKIAYLPVRAYQTTLYNSPVWLVAVEWEYPSANMTADLRHIRYFAFHQATLRQVGFCTCE